MRIETMRSTATPLPVMVNGTAIAAADIAREVQNHTGLTPGEAWAEATRALVVRELLAQRALEMGLAAEPISRDGLRETDEEALIRVLLEADIHTPKADDESCRRYYNANAAKFRRAYLYEPLHILFKANRDDEPGYSVAVERAEAVLAELREHPDRFESLARALSDCPSADDGGRLGQIAVGETTPEFDIALRLLSAGQLSPTLVRTRYGVHVLRLDRKVVGDVPPFDQVRGRIADWLEQSSWHRAAAQYVALLAGAARISGFDMQGAATPLVQ